MNSLEKFKESKFSKTGSENQHETEAFFVKNNTQIHAAGSKRNLDLSLNWMMTRPDWNLGALENGKASVDTKGHNPKWRNSYLSRELNWSIPNKVAEVELTGSAWFAKGSFGTATPTETLVKLKALLDQRDSINAVISCSRTKAHQCTLIPNVGCGAENKMTPHAVKLKTVTPSENIKCNVGNYKKSCWDSLENTKSTCDIWSSELRGGISNDLAVVATHPSSDKDMELQPPNSEDNPGLRIINRELLNMIQARNLRIIDLENKIETLETSLRERKEQSTLEILGEFLNIEVMEMEADPEDTGDDSAEAGTKDPDGEDRENPSTTSLVISAAIRKEGLEDGQTVRYDVIKNVIVETNLVVSSETKAFLVEALEDLQGHIIEIEQTQARDETRVADNNDIDQDDSTVSISQALEEFEIVLSEVPEVSK